MKIAVVRGPSLNQGEMQNYLPLARKHELTFVGSLSSHCDYGNKIRVKRPLCLGEVFNFFPGGIKFLYHFFGDPQVICNFDRIVAGNDIVHTAELTNYYSFQAIEARKKGLVKKVVVTCWENLGVRQDYPKQRQLKGMVARRADHFLAVTKKAKEVLLKEGVPEDKISVIPMGVDLEKFGKQKNTVALKNFSFPPGSQKILFVGRLVEEKGVFDLFAAAAKILKQEKRNNWYFLLVGEGPAKRRLKDLVKKEGIEANFWLLGALPYEEMPSVFGLADVFVLPSKPKRGWEEQFGLVLAEAMASGLPIIATKTGEIPEVIGEAGILVPPQDGQKLAFAMTKLILNQKYQKALAARARSRAEQFFDREKVSRKINNLYLKVLAE